MVAEDNGYVTFKNWARLRYRNGESSECFTGVYCVDSSGLVQ